MAQMESAGGSDRDLDRPCIIHLMCWALASALLLVLYEPADSRVGNIFPTTMAVFKVVNSIIYGGAATCLAVLTVRVARRPSAGRLEPGHWLLAGAAVPHVAWYVVLLFATRGGTLATRWGDDLYKLALGTGIFLTATIYAAACVWSRGRTSIVWIAILGLQFTLAGTYLGIYGWEALTGDYPGISDAISTWSGVLFTALLLSVAVAAIRRGIKRDWLHWSGVVVYLVNGAISSVWNLWAWRLVRYDTISMISTAPVFDMSVT